MAAKEEGASSGTVAGGRKTQSKMTFVILGLVEDAEHLDIALGISPEEDHVLLTGIDEQVSTQVSAILAKAGCICKVPERFVEFCKVTYGLIMSPADPCVVANTVKVLRCLYGQPEPRHGSGVCIETSERLLERVFRELPTLCLLPAKIDGLQKLLAPGVLGFVGGDLQP